MDSRIYSPEKGKFVSLKTKHGQKVLENYNEHRIGGDKHKNCPYCKIVNPQTGKLVSTYGQTGGRVISNYVEQEGGDKYIKFITFNGDKWLYYNNYVSKTKRNEIIIRVGYWYKYFALSRTIYIKIDNISNTSFNNNINGDYIRKNISKNIVTYTTAEVTENNNSFKNETKTIQLLYFLREIIPNMNYLKPERNVNIEAKHYL